MESNTQSLNCILVPNSKSSRYYFVFFIFETNQVTNVTANLDTKKRLMVTVKMLTNVLLVSTQNAMRMLNA